MALDWLASYSRDRHLETSITTMGQRVREIVPQCLALSGSHRTSFLRDIQATRFLRLRPRNAAHRHTQPIHLECRVSQHGFTKALLQHQRQEHA